MKLTELAAASHWVFGLVLADEQVEAQAMKAARAYLGWGSIASLEPPPEPDPAPLYGEPFLVGWYGTVFGAQPAAPAPAPVPPPPLDADTEITYGEWAVIKPLFELYVERENARALEASRSQGVDVYGRAVDVIEADIRQYETLDMPRLAFNTQPLSV